MFDINGGEFLVLGAVAVVILGPERLPTYAAQLGRMVREARVFARNAREQVRGEMGEDFDDIDWQALDPRRYDPRRIVRDALLDDGDTPGPSGSGSPGSSSRVSDRARHVPPAMRPGAAGDASPEPDDVDEPPQPDHSTPARATPAPTYDLDAT